jgi:hypothetical protein
LFFASGAVVLALRMYQNARRSAAENWSNSASTRYTNRARPRSLVRQDRRSFFEEIICNSNTAFSAGDDVKKAGFINS